MAPVYAGILSIIPPVVTIVLSLISKEVIISLLVGILSGSAIYSTHVGGGILETIKITFSTMAKGMGQNIFIIIFISLLGALVRVIAMAGGSQAYGKWALKRIKSRKTAQLATALLGMAISIDDYFNCLTVGTVMRPITDKHRVSRAKFAYIIDSMAAPVCVIAPISSWAASIISCIDSSELNGTAMFISTIPYNFYAILTIILVMILSSTKMDFGPMAKFEKNAVENGELAAASSDKREKADEKSKTSKKASPWDLIAPVFILTSVSAFVMLETGGFFNEGVSITEALGNANSGLSITVGGMCALTAAFVMFVPRGLISFRDFMDGVNQGIKSMVPAFLILSLAWTMSDVCGELICTGDYISDLAVYSNVETAFIPAFVFLLAGFLSFSLGTSWGTFGILIPVVISVCSRLSPDVTVIALSATLSGSVFGDHCSPISDTMVLSSAGADCGHVDHVSTQTPYACLVAAVACVGYVIAGFTRNAVISLAFSAAALVGCLIFFNKKFGLDIKEPHFSDASV